MNGRRSHQELMKSQSVIEELKPSSEDMGEIKQSLACLLIRRPAPGSDNRATTLAVALKGAATESSGEEFTLRFVTVRKAKQGSSIAVEFGRPCRSSVCDQNKSNCALHRDSALLCLVLVVLWQETLLSYSDARALIDDEPHNAMRHVPIRHFRFYTLHLHDFLNLHLQCNAVVKLAQTLAHLSLTELLLLFTL